MNIFLLIALVVGGFLLTLFLGLLLYRLFLRYSTKIETSNGISSLEEITLGSVKQWIFIRGTDQNNPLLLFLHGGPGVPLLGISSSRKNDKKLIEHFTVVHWDQRGAGKSYYRDIPTHSMTYDRFVEDCNELINYLRNRFSTPKVFIVAHSGGTVIGMKTVYKYPEKVYAYVGVGQSIDGYDEQKAAYDFVLEQAEKTGDLSRYNVIKAIGPPPYDSPKKYLKQAGHIGHYGGFLADSSFKQYLKMGILMIYFITSPEYSLSEGFRTILNKGFDFTMNAIWEEYKNINLTKEIQSIKVPIYFFEGKYDMTTPTVLVEKFYDNLNAEKGKYLVIFENSGHLPMIEEKERYEKLLINTVLKDTLHE
ncbi:MAG: alpha/beta fold hydrolase [Candidatus Kariarchaeaceae archaeon]|jgi:pimeloyl-ACP methyl ester carboxylesterase